MRRKVAPPFQSHFHLVPKGVFERLKCTFTCNNDIVLAPNGRIVAKSNWNYHGSFEVMNRFLFYTLWEQS